MIGTIEKTKCTGCKMCADVCPKDAVTFECDDEGFWYPKVDCEKCNRCKLCIKKCPSLNPDHLNIKEQPVVYSAWSKNDEIRITSTSGGVFYEIAKYVIEQGGAVVGCRYRSDWKSAEQVIAYDIEGLQEIKGSKYFQSDTQGIYKAVKKEVESGRIFLFCGTPCQNAALRSFLDKDYPNLYYMDFICRSINSPLAFEEYITELEKEYGSKAIEVHLKNKKNGWQSLASQVRFSNGKESIRDKNEDWWVKGFIFNDLYTRESCYHCQYKILPRATADISIGDFWGIKNQSDTDMFKGISVVLLNSKKGMTLFQNVEDVFEVKEHAIEEVIPGNPALFKNPIRTNKQDKFFKLIKKNPFSICVEKCIKVSIFCKAIGILRKILRNVKKAVQKVMEGKISIPKYIYYNYFCKNIVRDKKSKVIPYKNAILDLHDSARIYLHGNKPLEVGYNKLKGSKSETHIRMNENAIWNCNNGATLFYNTVLEVKEDAVFDSGYFSANAGSVIITDKHITFGEDVMIGRNVIIYDSDFHQLRNSDGIPVNPPKDVVIKDHVWLTSNVTVLKGVTIGRDSLITAQTVINKSVPEHSIIAGKTAGSVIKDKVDWNRQRCLRE